MEPSGENEREHSYFKSVVAAYINYQRDAYNDLIYTLNSFMTLPPKFRNIVPYNDRIEKQKVAISYNFYFLVHLIDPYKGMFEYTTQDDGNVVFSPLEVPLRNYKKVKSTIRQIVRDWTAYGKYERDMCYPVILAELSKRLPTHKSDGSKNSVLVPGGGLGRLSFEIASLGYKSQGNEFSYFMLLASDYILNKTESVNQFAIYPFVHDFCNLRTTEDLFKWVTVPDVCPSDILPEDSDFSMVAGEFVQVYSTQLQAWDCVVTCFFIDTANNVFEYIDTIYKCLTPGGYWINFGPLLYHYAEMPDEMSIELSWDELKHIISKFGFVIEKEEFCDALYASDASPMMRQIFKCIFFCARKPDS